MRDELRAFIGSVERARESLERSDRGTSASHVEYQAWNAVASRILTMLDSPEGSGAALEARNWFIRKAYECSSLADYYNEEMQRGDV